MDENGGFLVWEENGSIKTGSEIKAIRLDSNLTKVSGISINKVVTGEQSKPQASFLTGGATIFVWQGNGLKTFDIYARILKENGTFLTSDLRVNTYTKDQQSSPVVSSLEDGGAMIAWQSSGQDGSLMGIYARKILATGKLAPKEFQVNQFTEFNQRTPSIATLSNGNVVIAWVSEQERFVDSIDIYARLFNSSGEALSGELLLNSANNLCANPSVAALVDGGFTIAWSEKDALNRSNNWDIVGRSFSASGIPVDGDFKINTIVYGDQYRPKIATVGNDCFVVWTSLGHDGSREGVYGRVLAGGKQPVGNDLLINNTTVSQQIHPAVSSSGSNRFLVTWSSFVATYGFDLFGRKFTLNQQP
ncbi:MAG: hypothetical protein ABJC04_07355 [Verrucomicrobiota bacterium]